MAVEFGSQLIKLKESLMRFAFSLTGNKDDTHDLVQETFLKALTHSDKFVDESNLKAWTSTIMKNIFINNYRLNIRQNIYRDQTKESFFINQKTSACRDDPASVYSVLEITRNIEQLKDKFRIPFKMHINGYKYREIANELDLNIGTVKSRIFNSRKQLKERMKN